MKGCYTFSPLKGRICITAHKEIDYSEGEVVICGDPEGLTSLGTLLIECAQIDQTRNVGLPDDESEHIHLDCGVHIGKTTCGSFNAVISRLDTKSGEIKPHYIDTVSAKRDIKEQRTFVDT